MQKDTQNSEGVQAVGTAHSPMSFISDTGLGKICRKVTKITKAVCLVVSHVEHSKDIRKRVEGLAYDLSDITISLLYKSNEEQFKDKQVIFAKCISLVNFIELLNSLHLVSDTNAQILNGQIKLFMEDISNFNGVSHTTTGTVGSQNVGPAGESVASIFFDTAEEGGRGESAQHHLYTTDDTTENSYTENYIENHRENRLAVQPAANQSANHNDSNGNNSNNNSAKKENVQSKSKVVEVLSPAIKREPGSVRVTRSSFHPTNAEFRQRLANAKTLEDLHGIAFTDTEVETDTKKGVSTQAVTYKSAGVSNETSGASRNSDKSIEHSQPKTERQELIVKTIATKGELSIKDLEGVVKGCSEKTIQRELLSLVESGVLQKSGERRWSRYSLVQ